MVQEVSKKISDLEAHTGTLPGSAVLPVVVGGVTLRTTKDAILQGVSSLAVLPARVAITTHVADLASCSVSQDGVTLIAGDSVLLAESPGHAQNGLYTVGTVTAGNAPLTRRSDFNTSAEAVPGTALAVLEGSANQGLWFLSTALPITLGTTALTFVKSSGAITAVSQTGASLGQATSIKGQWFDVTVVGATMFVKPHARMPRARVRCVITTNVATPLNISISQDGLLGSTALRKPDMVWYAGQTNASENGLYRVVSVSGTATMAKLSLADAIIAETGLYLQISDGTSNRGTIRYLTGDGSFASSYLMPSATPSWFNLSRPHVEDFVLNADNTTPAGGNWQPVVQRALECMMMAGGELVFSHGHCYRFTSRINLWTATALVGNNTPVFYTATGPRLWFDGCAGFFAPSSGGETYDGVTYTGLECWPQLRGLNCMAINGSSDLHYAALFHAHAQVSECNFRNFYGRGVTIDSTAGLGGANGSMLRHVTQYGIGLSACFISGGDANNVAVTDCRFTNFAIREFEAIEYEPVTGLPSTTIANPAMVLNVAMTGTVTPAVTLSGTRSFAAGLVPVLKVEINSVAGGTALTQAFFRVSYDNGATWALAGAGGQATAATVALDGIASGCVLNFPVGTYATSYSWTGSIMPGDDWGIIDDSFLGITVINTELSAFHNGGIYSLGAHSLYLKLYTEAGTECDVVESQFISGNPTVRTGNGLTKLPLQRMDSSNVLQFSNIGITSDAANMQLGGASDGFEWVRGLSGDVTGWRRKLNTSGGNTGLITRGWGSGNSGQNEFATLSSHALGTSMQGFLKGVFLGTGLREQSCARASLPSTGVPLSSSSSTNFDGPWPIGSIAWEPTSDKAWLGQRVLTNSGSALYTLVWCAIPNPGCPDIALATGNQTRLITDGGRFVMAAATTAAASVITLGTTGALKGDVQRYTIRPQGHNVTITNGGAGGTGAMPDKVVTAGVESYGEYEFNGTDWIGHMSTCI